MKNGLAVAHFLEASPRVERVIHPGQYQTKYEPHCEKTGLRGFRPGPTQTGLYS